MRDRVERIKRKEQTRRELLDKNKITARSMKMELYRNMQRTKELEQQKLAKVKERKLKDKLTRASENKNSAKNHIRERLESERKNSQANLELLKELEAKEMRLLTNLQEIVSNTREVIDHARDATYLSFYYDQLPRAVTASRNLGYTSRSASSIPPNKHSK